MDSVPDAADLLPVPAWIAADREEIEDPDRLDEAALTGSVNLRVDGSRGRLRFRRGTVRGAARTWSARASWLRRDDARGRGSAVVERASGPVRARIAAGWIVMRDAPALFGEDVGLARRVRRVSRPRIERPSPDIPSGASSLALAGVGAGAGAGPVDSWLVMGRRDSGAIAAGGVSFERGRAAIAAAAGARRYSISGRFDSAARAAGFEVMLRAGAGPAFLAEASALAQPIALTARWRRRSGEARPVAAELVAAAALREARWRVTWRPWSAGAHQDDGVLEAEGFWRGAGQRFGPVKVRLGTRAGGGGGAGTGSGSGSGPPPESEPRERFVVADVTLARERGRSLALLVSRRERRAASGWGAGESVGGRLEIASRGRFGVTLLAQSTRVAEGGAPAWTSGISASGDGILVSRGGSGLSFTGRGWMRLGPVRLQALVADADAASGAKQAAGTLWAEWAP